MNYSIKAKLQTSLIHTEDVSSNIANIYRENIKIGEEIHHIPALHGNSIRGQFRDIGADHLLTAVEVEPNSLPTDLFYMLFSGGSLTKSETTIDIEKRIKTRKMLPFLSIFGTAAGNEMIQGKLKITRALPDCSELGTGTTSYNDMTDIVRYTRQDDKKKLVGEKFTVDEQSDKPQQMFYDTEVIKAGVTVSFEIYLDSTSEIELGCLHNIIREFKKQPFLGGASRVGHGKVEIDFVEDEKLIEQYLQFLNDNKDDIRKHLLEEFAK